MKNLFALASITALFFAIAGCSDSTSSSSDGTVNMNSEMSGARTSESGGGGKGYMVTAGVQVDSIKIVSVKVLFTNLKLHHDESDSAGKGTIKTGPFLVEFTASGTKVITSS